MKFIDEIYSWCWLLVRDIIFWIRKIIGIIRFWFAFNFKDDIFKKQ